MRAARLSFAGLSLVLLVVLGASACATKKFVRTEVGQTATELNKKIEADRNVMSQHDAQISELSSLGKGDREAIGQVEEQVKRTDQTATEAQRVGSEALGQATTANKQVVELNDQFAKRNEYQVASTEEIPFKVDHADLTPEGKEKLEALASKLKSDPNAIVELEGHTDATGPAEYNVTLAERRIESVMRYLAVNNEVPMRKMYKLSFGEERPVADNKSREGRTRNRVVVVRVLEPTSTGVSSQGGQVQP